MKLDFRHSHFFVPLDTSPPTAGLEGNFTLPGPCSVSGTAEASFHVAAEYHTPGPFAISGVAVVPALLQSQTPVRWWSFSYTPPIFEEGCVFHGYTNQNPLSIKSRSNKYVTEGKYYFEVELFVINAFGSTVDNQIGIGAGNLSYAPGYTATSWGYKPYSGQKFNNAIGTAVGPEDQIADGTVIGVAFDLASGTVFFSVDGIWLDNSDPATGANPAFSNVTGTVYAMATVAAYKGVRGRFSSGDFVHTMPGGFAPFDSYNVVSSLGYKTPGPFNVNTAHVDGYIFIAGLFSPPKTRYKCLTNSAVTASVAYLPPGPFRIQGSGAPDSIFKLPFRVVTGLSWNQQSRFNYRKDAPERLPSTPGPWDSLNAFNNVTSALWVTKNRTFWAGGTTGSHKRVRSVAINEDGTLGDWTFHPDLPVGRIYAQAVVTYRRVYLLGGWDPDSSTSSLPTATALTASIDPDGSLGEWEIVDGLLGADGYGAGGRYLFSLICQGNQVYLLGGQLWNGDETYTCRRATIDQDGRLGVFVADDILPSSQGRTNGAVIQTHKYVYLIGGDTAVGLSTTVDRREVNELGLTGLFWEQLPQFAGVPFRSGVRGFSTRYRAWLFGFDPPYFYSAPISATGELGAFERSESWLYGGSEANIFATQSKLVVGGSITDFVGGLNNYLDANLQGDYPPPIADGNVLQPQSQITASGPQEVFVAEGAISAVLDQLNGAISWGHTATGMVQQQVDFVRGVAEVTAYTADGSVIQPNDTVAGVAVSSWVTGHVKPKLDRFSILAVTPQMARGNFRSKPDIISGLGKTVVCFNDLPARISGVANPGVVSKGRYIDRHHRLVGGVAQYAFHHQSTGSIRELLANVSGSVYLVSLAAGKYDAGVDGVHGVGWIPPLAAGLVMERPPVFRGRFSTGQPGAHVSIMFSRDPIVAPVQSHPEHEILCFGRGAVTASVNSNVSVTVTPLRFTRKTSQ